MVQNSHYVFPYVLMLTMCFPMYSQMLSINANIVNKCSLCVSLCINQDLANILGLTNSLSDHVHVWDFLHSRFRDFHIARFQDPQKSRFQDFQIQGCQLACLLANCLEEPSGPKMLIIRIFPPLPIKTLYFSSTDRQEFVFFHHWPSKIPNVQREIEKVLVFPAPMWEVVWFCSLSSFS